MNRVSVLVAGAGPAGALAAWRLAEAGVDVLLLEAQAAPAEDMRASTMHPPTLAMLDEVGLLPELEAQGLRAPVYQHRNRDTGEVISLDLTEIGDVTPFPYRLQCEQYKLTRLIAARLKDHPHGRLLTSRRLLYFDQDAAGVTATVETPIAVETWRADYLIGADGGNSIVRKLLGVEFTGFTYPERFLTLSTAWPMENAFDDLANVAYLASSKEWCVLLRVPELWRVLVPAYETESDAALVSDAKKTAVFDALMGNGQAVQTHHRTIYRVHQRVAETYRRGRALLIGDAAHLNNPLGGFGMNSGIHDAWNLTEKLIRILQDGADADAELDHFDRQRRTVMHEFVQAQTIRNKAALEIGAAQARSSAQAQLEALLGDTVKRREHLLNQAMLTSLVREAEIP